MSNKAKPFGRSRLEIASKTSILSLETERRLDCGGVQPPNSKKMISDESYSRPLMSGNDDDADDRDGSGTGVVTRTRQKTKKPSMYN